MRIFSVIFLIMILIAVNTAAYGSGGFVLIVFPLGDFPGGSSGTGPDGFWFKPDSDREQLKQDYSECRGKAERSCMREKGYFWLAPDTGFWYKIGVTTQQQIVDYSECRGKIGERLCMEDKGYTWASYYPSKIK